MSTLTFFKTSPEDVFEATIIVPKDNDLPITVQAVNNDDNNTPYDFSGQSVELQIFEHHSDDTADALVTVPNGSWTQDQSAEGVIAGVNDIVKTTVAWATLHPTLDLVFEYWFRIIVTDATGDDYTIIRGEFILEDK